MLPTIISRCEVTSIPPLSDNKIAEILNIPKNHELIEYAEGSATALKFYISIEEQIKDLVAFIDQKDKFFSDINNIVFSLAENIKGSTKAEEMENAEYIYAFIIKHLLKKAKSSPERSKIIVPVIQELNTIAKKLYTNTSASMVMENMLLELAVRSI